MVRKTNIVEALPRVIDFVVAGLDKNALGGRIGLGACRGNSRLLRLDFLRGDVVLRLQPIEIGIGDDAGLSQLASSLQIEGRLFFCSLLGQEHALIAE